MNANIATIQRTSTALTHAEHQSAIRAALKSSLYPGASDANIDMVLDYCAAAGLDPMPSMVLLVYGAYVGAGRDGEAKKIYDECVRLDDTEAMRQALANMARSMQEARSRSSVVH